MIYEVWVRKGSGVMAEEPTTETRWQFLDLGYQCEEEFRAESYDEAKNMLAMWCYLFVGDCRLERIQYLT